MKGVVCERDIRTKINNVDKKNFVCPSNIDFFARTNCFIIELSWRIKTELSTKKISPNTDCTITTNWNSSNWFDFSAQIQVQTFCHRWKQFQQKQTSISGWCEFRWWYLKSYSMKEILDWTCCSGTFEIHSRKCFWWMGFDSSRRWNESLSTWSWREWNCCWSIEMFPYNQSNVACICLLLLLQFRFLGRYWSWTLSIFLWISISNGMGK